MENLFPNHPVVNMEKGFTKWDDVTRIDDLLDYVKMTVEKNPGVEISIGTDSVYKPIGDRKSKKLIKVNEVKNDWKCTYLTTISFSFYGRRGHHIIQRTEVIFGKNTLDLFTRIWREVVMSVDLGVWLFENTEIIPEIHFDINQDAEHDSNVVLGAAVGYAMMKGLKCKFKPDAPAASKASDHKVKQLTKPRQNRKTKIKKGKTKQLSHIKF
jgi:predicted RNase H-related nuclease YkuK (DUF458 family)